MVILDQLETLDHLVEMDLLVKLGAMAGLDQQEPLVLLERRGRQVHQAGEDALVLQVQAYKPAPRGYI